MTAAQRQSIIRRLTKARGPECKDYIQAGNAFFIGFRFPEPFFQLPGRKALMAILHPENIRFFQSLVEHRTQTNSAIRNRQELIPEVREWQKTINEDLQ